MSKVNTFIQECQSVYTESNISQMKKHKFISIILMITYVLLLVPVIAAGNDPSLYPLLFAFIIYVLYIWLSRKMNHGSVHKLLSNRSKELLDILVGANFSENDIELDKIGLD